MQDDFAGLDANAKSHESAVGRALRIEDSNKVHNISRGRPREVRKLSPPLRGGRLSARIPIRCPQGNHSCRLAGDKVYTRLKFINLLLVHRQTKEDKGVVRIPGKQTKKPTEGGDEDADIRFAIGKPMV